MILIVAEKAQAAQKIAEALAEGKVETKTLQGHPYYIIKWQGKETAVVPLRGHIMNYDYPEKFNSWAAVDPMDLIEINSEKKLSSAKIAGVIKQFSPEYVIHACDADPEGENIGFEAIDILKKPAKRAWFSALTKEELREAFSKLRQPDKGLSASIDARMQVDLMFGAVLTREITLSVKRNPPISVGRCQTPTLRFVVEKELKVKAFKSEKFWEVVALLEKDAKQFEAYHKNGRFMEKEKAQAVLKPGQPVVTNVSSSRESVTPPIPLDTTLLLRSLNAFFNIPTKKGMEMAEQLYLSGYITYPRTDTNVYPKDVHPKLLQALEKSEHGKYIQQLLAKGYKVTNGKKDVGDHPPVMPTTEVPKDLTGPLAGVYDFILRHYLATLSPNAEIINTEVDLDISSQPFLAEGMVIDVPGFIDIYPFRKVKVFELPKLSKGDKPKLLSLDIKEGETKPPPRYSEGTLIKLMEKEGIGTKSTRQDHLETLKDRKYVEADGKSLVATELGIKLIEGLEKSAERITLPDFTRTLEDEMDQVAHGKRIVAAVVTDARKELKGMMTNLRANKDKLVAELKQAMYADRRKPIGTCPRCGKSLLVRFSKNKKRFVGCSGYPSCTQTYSLPQKGLIKPRNVNCEKCGTPILEIKTGRFSYKTCLTPSCTESIWYRMQNNNNNKSKEAKDDKPKEAKASQPVSSGSSSASSPKRKTSSPSRRGTAPRSA